MRSRADRCRSAEGFALRWAIVLMLALAAVAAPARAAQAPDDAAIHQAIERVKADPNLATERTIKTLRWKSTSKPAPPNRWAWLDWLVDLFGWIARSMRRLVWVSLIVMAGMLAIYLTRMFRGGSDGESSGAFVAPTHVRDLDVRPESLPPDIGAAARGRWDAGDRRAAMALLYRGLLSRLIHVHQVPIRASSTEGDCLTLAAPRLKATGQAYASRLVALWQRFVYAGDELETASVYGLCDDFAPALDRRALPAAADGDAA